MKSKLGQNFLIDEKIASREVKYACINKNDIVLEIGPGKGILTKILAKKAKKVIAVEIDETLFNSLYGVLPDNVDLINDDVLKVDFNDLPRFNKVVSNLPFKISSPITFKLLNFSFDIAVLIFQKEFADRLVAKASSKEYSRLSVNVYYKALCEIIENVPKSCFKPQPKIDASIVRLILRKKVPFVVKDEHFFYDLLRDLFNHRRKKIRYTLKNVYNINNIDNIPFVNNRIGELLPEQIGKLSNFLYDEYL